MLTPLEGLDRALTSAYDAIVMDLSLPGLDGLALCQALRQRAVFTPILMLTARASEVDKVLGLEVGADDYMTKPFSLRELRVTALLRRGQRYAAPATLSHLLTFGDLQIDVDRRWVIRAGQSIELTAKEFDLLVWFAQHPGRVFSRESLLSAVGPATHPDRLERWLPIPRRVSARSGLGGDRREQVTMSS